MLTGSGNQCSAGNAVVYLLYKFLYFCAAIGYISAFNGSIKLKLALTFVSLDSPIATYTTARSWSMLIPSTVAVYVYVMSLALTNTEVQIL